jgi:hypothetical protein
MEQNPMGSDNSEFSTTASPSRWVLFTIDQQGMAVLADTVQAIFSSCLPEQSERYCDFLTTELHEGRPVFMRPLTELFKLADPHYFASSQPRPWCLVVRGQQEARLGCWVDEVTGPILATPSMGQVTHQQRNYLTALPAAQSHEH